jgi:hypothetical protein
MSQEEEKEHVGLTLKPMHEVTGEAPRQLSSEIKTLELRAKNVLRRVRRLKCKEPQARVKLKKGGFVYRTSRPRSVGDPPISTVLDG